MSDSNSPDHRNVTPTPSVKSKEWVIICLALAAASILYRVMVLNQQEQSSMLFIGIPLFLAIALSQVPRPKSATGVIIKGITLAMLLFGILFIEGFICILITSPLFFLVGGIVGLIMDRRTKSKNLKCSVIGVLLLMSVEGVTEILSFSRDETVNVSKKVNLTAHEARQRLSTGPKFDLNELPLFLTMGFPMPDSIEGSGTNVGDIWKIHFAGGEGKPGDLIVKVTSSDNLKIVYECVEDSSHIAHWMDWKKVSWTIKEIDGNSCLISMTLEYDRLLDPAWYFKPVERYGVTKAAEYFISQTF